MRKQLLSALLLAPALAFSAGSAIITLEMPVGARQLGMGEAGAALADDATAMYYNPAGLAFGPLADEWRMSYKADSKTAPYFTCMASRSKPGFFSKSELWAGTAEGILKFDGEEWVNYHSITLQGNAKVKDAVKVYAGSERGLEENLRQVKAFNDIKTAEDEKHVIEVKMPWNLIVKTPSPQFFTKAAPKNSGSVHLSPCIVSTVRAGKIMIANWDPTASTH